MKLQFGLVLSFLFVLNTLQAQTDGDYHRAFVEKYKSDLTAGNYAPLKKADLENIHFFDWNQEFRLAATYKPLKSDEFIEIPTSAGKIQHYIKIGYLLFEIYATKHKLSVYKSRVAIKSPGYEDYVFLPFKDASNGSTTYGGGRYIDLKMSDLLAEKVILDFNLAYNPYCAFADGYSCPIPPKENHLPVQILAGEKAYGVGH